jgi:hypothetical protein
LEKFKALVVATGAMLKRRKEESREEVGTSEKEEAVVEDEASGEEIGIGKSADERSRAGNIVSAARSDCVRFYGTRQLARNESIVREELNRVLPRYTI